MDSIDLKGLSHRKLKQLCDVCRTLGKGKWQSLDERDSCSCIQLLEKRLVNSRGKSPVNNQQQLFVNVFTKSELQNILHVGFRIYLKNQPKELYIEELSRILQGREVFLCSGPSGTISGKSTHPLEMYGCCRGASRGGT